MQSPSGSIIGIWLHSQEEDRPDARVYRPSGYAFPPTRGRSAVEFRADGTYVEHSGGPDDRGATVVGSWQDVGGGRVQMTMPHVAGRASTRLVLSWTEEILLIAR